MTEPQHDYKSFFEMSACRSTCAICGDPSPIVFVERTRDYDKRERVTRNYKIRVAVSELLRDHGWVIDLKKDRAVCPSCKGIGSNNEPHSG